MRYRTLIPLIFLFIALLAINLNAVGATAPASPTTPAPSSGLPPTSSTGISVSNPSGGCLVCSELSNAQQAQLITEMNTVNKTLTINAYYDMYQGTTDVRSPINNSLILVEVTNTTGLSEIYKIFTDENGSAWFSFSNYPACAQMRVMYCPYCEPGSRNCAFNICMQYLAVNTSAGYYSNVPATGIVDVSSIESAPNGSSAVPAIISGDRFLPQTTTQSYCTPPTIPASAPAVCLPLVIIFALLGGALYASGKNPFSSFNIGSTHVGSALRYQARGRGFQQSATSIGFSVGRGASEGAQIAKGGTKAITSQQNQNFIGAGVIRGVKTGIPTVHLASKTGASAKGMHTFSREMDRGSGSGQAATTMTMGPGGVLTQTGGGSRVSLADMPTTVPGRLLNVVTLLVDATIFSRIFQLFGAGSLTNLVNAINRNPSAPQVLQNGQNYVHEARRSHGPVTVNGRQVTIISMTNGNAGLESSQGQIILACDQGSGANQTANGQITYTTRIQREGSEITSIRIEGVSYMLTVPAASANEFSTGGVPLQTDSNGNVTLRVNMTEGAAIVSVLNPSGQGEQSTRTISPSNTREWSAVISPYTHQDLRIGADATPYNEAHVAQYQDAQRAYTIYRDSLEEGIHRAERRFEGNPEIAAAIERQRRLDGATDSATIPAGTVNPNYTEGSNVPRILAEEIPNPNFVPNSAIVARLPTEVVDSLPEDVRAAVREMRALVQTENIADHTNNLLETSRNSPEAQAQIARGLAGSEQLNGIYATYVVAMDHHPNSDQVAALDSLDRSIALGGVHVPATSERVDQVNNEERGRRTNIETLYASGTTQNRQQAIHEAEEAVRHYSSIGDDENALVYQRALIEMRTETNPPARIQISGQFDALGVATRMESISEIQQRDHIRDIQTAAGRYNESLTAYANAWEGLGPEGRAKTAPPPRGRSQGAQ